MCGKLQSVIVRAEKIRRLGHMKITCINYAHVRSFKKLFLTSNETLRVLSWWQVGSPYYTPTVHQ